MLAQLSELLDPIGLRMHIAEGSKHGRRPHKSGDPWGFTREYMATYAKLSNPAEVIALFDRVGARNDLDAGRWLLIVDAYVE